MQCVINSFLTSPCTEAQVLKFDPVVVRGDIDDTDTALQNLVAEESDLQYKSLEICIKEIETASNFRFWLLPILPFN